MAGVKTNSLEDIIVIKSASSCDPCNNDCDEDGDDEDGGDNGAKE